MMCAPAMRSLAVIALCLALPLPCAAQAGAPVAKPDVKAGDRWVYRRTDYARNKPAETYELRVTFSGRNAIHGLMSGPGGAPSDVTYTSEWNDVVSHQGVVNLREKGELQFPLVPGASYRIAWDLENPRFNREGGRHERTVKVIGWEEVAVPAGKFRALKIVSEGTFRPFVVYNMMSHGTARDTFWYVPEVKRWVRHLHEGSMPIPGSRGVTERVANGEELIEFKVQ